MPGEFSHNKDNPEKPENGEQNKLNQFDDRMPEGETEKQPQDKLEEPYNPDDRIPETAEPNEVESLGHVCIDYLKNIREYSECPETISALPFKVSDLKVVPPEVTKQLRSEFRSQKPKLISEWEKLNGREWPRYDHDIIGPSGKVIRRKGDLYDAHHIQPLSLGGENIASNITPLRAEVHYDSQGVHAADSPCSKMCDMMRGSV